MRSRAIILGCTGLLLALGLQARDKSDVVVLANGDHLTCEVKYLKGGVLYVSLDYVDGTIAVQWSKVTRLESHQLFIAQTLDGMRYSGTLTTAARSPGSPVTLEIAGKTGHHVSLDESSIVSLLQTSDRFWQRFEGEVNAGVNQAKGNNLVQYGIGSQVIYRRERWSAMANINSNFSSEDGANTSTRNQFTLSGYHMMGRGNNFYFGLGSFLQDSVQKISSRGTIGAGVGRFLKNTNRSRISLMAGLAWQRTDYNSLAGPLGSQTLGAGMIGSEVSFFRFKRTTLDSTTYLFQAFTQPERGRLYLVTNVSYYLKIVRNLHWNLSFYGNWDSDPPGNLPGSDYGSTSGLRWTFGGR